MSKVRVESFAISIDGYGTGPGQDLQNPLGVNGAELMEWFVPTHVWQQMQGQSDGERGVDNDMAEHAFAGVGAWILGRNMFGPVRGAWPDDSWKGGWGGRAAVPHAGVRADSPCPPAGLIDELRLAIRPVLLGSGEHLLRDINLRALGYECQKSVAGERATHVFLRKRR